MSESDKLTVAFTPLPEENPASEDIVRKLTELSEKMYFTGFGSEGDDPVEVVHLPTKLEYLDASALADALGFNTTTPEQAIARFYPYSPGLSFELIDTLYTEEENSSIRTNEIVRLMTSLHHVIIVIFGEDMQSPPQHPVYWVGLAADGSIVGLKSLVIWT